MNRRSFLTGLAALVGGIALEEAIPFNRVWSFPSKIVYPGDFGRLATIYYSEESLQSLTKSLIFKNFSEIKRIPERLDKPIQFYQNPFSLPPSSSLPLP